VVSRFANESCSALRTNTRKEKIMKHFDSRDHSTKATQHVAVPEASVMEGLVGKVVIVTGAADGLGRATSRLMATKGARVLLVDINEPRLAETEALIGDAGGEAAVFRADVSDEAQVRAYVAEAMRRFGRIDAFFNNAGILGAVAPMIDYPIDTFDRVIAINLRGVFLGLRFVLPVMIEQRAGSIINTGSMASAGGVPGSSAYSAAKHAVIGLTKTAAIEVGPMGVRVNGAAGQYPDQDGAQFRRPRRRCRERAARRPAGPEGEDGPAGRNRRRRVLPRVGCCYAYHRRRTAGRWRHSRVSLWDGL
jgi:NAD(P)-dependent dehydrogenase (short-subunit alcohol dehydrogenase family)